MEVWKDINEYEGLYQVSNLGNVKSLARPKITSNGIRNMPEKILKPQIQRGYLKVMLYKDNKCKWCSIHRLVAEAFIENVEGKNQVNHINGNKTDNNANNLEWCTHSENQLHRLYVLKQKQFSIPVICVELNQEYESSSEAGKQLNICSKHIGDCCKGRRETTGGYHWKYKDAQ